MSTSLKTGLAAGLLAACAMALSPFNARAEESPPQAGAGVQPPLPSGEIGTVLNLLFKDRQQDASRPPPSPARLRDPGVPADAREIQERLAKLGYLRAAHHNWSADAGQALRRFKAAFNLAADEVFDEATQRVLFDRALVEEASFVGLWAPNQKACSPRSNAGGQLPATINHEGAWAGQVSCAFRNGRRDGDDWRFAATCKGARTSWSSNVRLTVKGDKLTWSSGRGVTHYVRCSVVSEAAR